LGNFGEIDLDAVPPREAISMVEHVRPAAPYLIATTAPVCMLRAGFKQQFFHEGVADLHVGRFCFDSSVNSAEARREAHEFRRGQFLRRRKSRIADAFGFGQKDSSFFAIPSARH